MSAAVFRLLRRAEDRSAPWSNQELAELYRVANTLTEAGLPVETDSGLSDEGDPWFIFCRVDSGDVIAHFARIDGEVVACGLPRDQVFRGRNFREVARRLLDDQPLVLPKRPDDGTTFLHPAVVLTAFVATALLYSTESHAGAPDAAGESMGLRSVLEPASSAIFSFLAGGGSEAKGDAKPGEQFGGMGQFGLMAALSAALVASAGDETYADGEAEGGLELAGSGMALDGKGGLVADQAQDGAQSSDFADAEGEEDAAFGLGDPSSDGDVEAGGAGAADGFLVAAGEPGGPEADGGRGSEGASGGRAAQGQGSDGAGLDGDDLDGVEVHAAAKADAEAVDEDARRSEDSTDDSASNESKAGGSTQGRDHFSLDLRDDGFIFEVSGKGASAGGENYVLAITKSGFEDRGGEESDLHLSEETADGTAHSGIEADAAAQAEDNRESSSDQGERGQETSADANGPAQDQESGSDATQAPGVKAPILFSGGDLVLDSFEVGVDILLIDDSRIDASAARVRQDGDDLVMDFGQDGSVTIVGAMDTFSDIA